MSISYFSADPDERVQLLDYANARTGIPHAMLEKDIMVVYSLQQIFNSGLCRILEFKGGTMLSKCEGITERFSEDIDFVVNALEIFPHRVENGKLLYPANGSQDRKMKTELRRYLREWVHESLAPFMERCLSEDGIEATLEIRTNMRLAMLLIRYEPLFQVPNPFLVPVKIELGDVAVFGNNPIYRSAECYAGRTIGDLILPYAPKIRVVDILQAYCDKLDASHRLSNVPGDFPEGQSRHHLDLVKLHLAGLTERAIANKHLVLEASKHSFHMFRKEGIDDTTLTEGRIRLAMSGERFCQFSSDYNIMLDSKIEFGERMSSSVVNRYLQEIQDLWNNA